MIQPAIFIGIGDTGEKSLRALKQSLKTELQECGWNQSLPESWAFLNFDLTDESTVFHQPPLEDVEKHSVNSKNEPFQNLTRKLERTKNENQVLLTGWAARSESSHSPLMRNIHRQAYLTDAYNILKTLQNSVAGIQSLKSLQQLSELNSFLGNATKKPSPQAFFFGSISSGAGGALLDTAEILKLVTQDNWVSESTTILFAESLREGNTDNAINFGMNALAFMNEFVASRTGYLSERTNLMWEKLGINYHQKTKDYIGSASYIHISRPSGVAFAPYSSLESDDASIQYASEFLANSLITKHNRQTLWMLNVSPKLQATNFADMSRLVRLKSPNINVGLTSIGQCKIVLGLEEHLQYVTDLITQHQVKTLLSKSEDRFLNIEFDAKIKSLKSTTLKQIHQYVMSPTDTEILIDYLSNNSIEKFDVVVGRNFPALSELYLEILEYCESNLFESGLESLHKDLSRVLGILKSDLYREFEKGSDNAVSRLFMKREKNVPPFNKKDEIAKVQFNNDIIEMNRNVMMAQIKQHVFGTLVERFISKLQTAIDFGRISLERELAKHVNYKHSSYTFSQFPSWGDAQVGEQYRVASNTAAILDSKDFNQFFQDLTNVTTQQEFSQFVSEMAKKARQLSSSQSIKNFMNLAYMDLEPGISHITEVQLDLSLDALRSLVRFTLLETQPIYSNSIAEFVMSGKDEQERANRENWFIRSFGEAVKKASPWSMPVNQNFDSRVQILDGSSPLEFQVIIDSIPFPIESSIGRQCASILRESSNLSASLQSLSHFFEPSSSRKICNLNTVSHSSLPIWMFESVSSSITQAIQIAKQADATWSRAWQGRRARPLLESVPFSTDIVSSIVTGWLVARLFGLIEITKLESGRGARMWNPTLDTEEWATFPTPLLFENSRDLELPDGALTSLLSSAGIALLTSSSDYSNQDLQSYRLLQYLGREVTTHTAKDLWDSHLGDALPSGIVAKSDYVHQWVTTGKPPSNLPIAEILKKNAELLGTYKEGLLATIDTWKEQYSTIWKAHSDAEWFNLPDTWELKDLLTQALDDIHNYVNQISSTVQAIAPSQKHELRETSKEHQVFISHSSNEIGLARALKIAVEKLGIKVWLAETDITPGTDYASKIYPAIEQSTGFVMIVSRGALESVHVAREFDHAEATKIPIIPISLIPIANSLQNFPTQWHYRLKIIQMLQHVSVEESAQAIYGILTGID